MHLSLSSSVSPVSLALIACLSQAWAFDNRQAHSQDAFELSPIRYSATESNDPVAQLKRQLDSGAVRLERAPQFGMLLSLLRALDVPVESQVLVFSKTSLQIHKISPTNPRALYFNDSVYIGYVPGSDLLELAANDPKLGAVFYTLDSRGDDVELEESETTESPRLAGQPRLVRDRGQCLSCHATTRTENVPGYLVRSVYPDRAGRPRTGSSSYTTDDRSPWSQRWGGWYVTGQHGTMRHMGNAFAIDRSDPQKMNVEDSANLISLPSRVPPNLHPLATSDIVALLVLEHQTRVHNLITRANFETTQAIAMDEAMNTALGRPKDHRSESTQRRIAASADALVTAMLMLDEPALESRVEGSSRFATTFAERGPKTQDGRSLRELDLEKRLFRYPLSYLIYTPEFQALPTEVMRPVRERLRRELTTPTSDPSPTRLTDSDRNAVRQILEETLPNWLNTH
jgi:hypothetical protein